MNRTVARVILFAIGGAVAIALVLGVITARSLHSIGLAQTPVTTQPAEGGAVFAQMRARKPTTGPTVRVAVIGGMTFTGFWNDLAGRYEAKSGVNVQLIASGEKNDIAAIFKQGGVDVITMHASDTIINLVADGYAMEPHPWMRNDLIIVGPADDPAGIKGMTDAAGALKKIAAAKSAFVVHSSLGSQEVLRNILDPNQIELNAAATTALFDDKQRSVLLVAGQRHAYTLVGRIPFKIGRLPNNGLEVMVQGDARLRRPYIVAVANPRKIADARVGFAREFEAYLLSRQTQEWIAGYGRGLIDDGPVFFPIAQPLGEEAVVLRKDSVRVGGAVSKPGEWTAKEMKDKFGAEIKEIHYSGKGGKHVSNCVPLIALLKAAGADVDFVMKGGTDPKTKNAQMREAVVVSGRDGYTVLFSLAEMLPMVGNRAVWVALDEDGKALGEKDGPVRLIVPEDKMAARGVHEVGSIAVVQLEAPATQPAAGVN